MEDLIRGFSFNKGIKIVSKKRKHVRTGNMQREVFIEKAQKIHTTAYDYDTLEYTNLYEPAYLVCPIHGRFKFNPIGHIRRKKHESSQGCPDCTKYRKFLDCAIELKEFMKKVLSIHGYFYNYNKLTIYQGRKDRAFGANITNTDKYYVRSSDKHAIICPIHGEFTQSLSNHTNKTRPHGCPKCARELQSFQKLTKLTECIKQANELHENKFSYLLLNYKTLPWYLKGKGVEDVKYVDSREYHDIICPIHGIFPQKLSSHIDTKKPKGCKKCAIDAQKDTTESYIIKARLVHGDLYDYSLVDYVHSQGVIKIICPIHGVFPQVARDHLTGCGCIYCSASRGEKAIRRHLMENKIEHKQQKTFKLCKYKHALPFDFYLPDYDLLIEYQGIQHYEAVDFFGGEEGFIERRKKDKIKKDYAEKHHNFLAIPYWDFDNIETILKQTIEKLEQEKGETK
jgi:hypothetical protein